MTEHRTRIRALLVHELLTNNVNPAPFENYGALADHLADVLAEAWPKATERVEWGIYNPKADPAYWPDRVIPVADPFHDASDLRDGEHLVRRTVTTYEPEVGDWEAVDE